MYDNSRYANTRLASTIVMYKRKPVYVIEVKRDMTVIVAEDFPVYTRRKRVPLEDLNITDFKLGFLNKDGLATYLARRTLRSDWRQGLRTNNVNSSQGRATLVDIANVLKQRYPSLEDAMRTRRLVHSIAWCPEFALSTNDLIWRYERVGKVEDGNLVLDNNFKFLTSQLMEAVNGYCEVL